MSLVQNNVFFAQKQWTGFDVFYNVNNKIMFDNKGSNKSKNDVHG